MKILSISLDKKIFEENSAARQRHIEYGKLCEALSIIMISSLSGKNFNTAKYYKNALAENVVSYGFNGGGIVRFMRAYKLAKKIIMEEKINLITAQDPFVAGLLGWLLKRKLDISLQLQIHADFLSPYFGRESIKNRMYVILAKFLLPRADGIRVVSERIKNSIIQDTRYKMQDAKVIVLPIFTDAEKIDSAPIKIDLREKYPQFDFRILMASRFSKEKNVGLAIQAMAEIAKKYLKTGLIIAGSGPEKNNLEFKIKNLKLRDNVALEPWSDDLASYYKTADLFLLTSNYEGYGLVVAEAIASGLPVLMTDVGCAGEMVISNENGLVALVGDKQGIIDALEKMIGNKEIRKKLKDGALRSRGKFISKEEYLELYKKSWEMCLKGK